MGISVIQRAKNKGYRIAVSEKGFTRQGYKYRITKADDKRILMYAHNLSEIAFLTKKRNYF